MIPNKVDLRGKVPTHPTKTWTKRSLDSITHIIVHHSATSENAVPLKTVQAFNRGHIRRGWPGIGYHFVIDSAGTIYHTTANTSITYHAGNWNVNKHSLGVCLIGKLHLWDPTEAQLLSLRRICRILNLPALPHYEIVGTVCPGRRWWKQWGDWVNAPPEQENNVTEECTLTLHYQIGLPPEFKQFVRTSGVSIVKAMDPGDQEPFVDEFPDLRWIFRFYENENIATQEVLKKKQGAYERLHRVGPELRKRLWMAKPRFYLEYMNEPSNAGLLMTEHNRQALDIFTAEYTRLLHEEFGIQGCGYCLGVGHPEPGHVGGLFKAGLAALKKYNGIWALHEYGYPTVLTYDPDGTLQTHHTLRHRRTIDALKSIGWKEKELPKLHITEAGIDRLLTGVVGGWKQINNDPSNYVAQLRDYDHECRKCQVVEAVYVYTATPQQTWWSYGINEADSEVLAHYIATGEIK